MGSRIQTGRSAEDHKEVTMEHGDPAKIIGGDGGHVFLKEVQGVTALRRGEEVETNPL
jgi:hypothetical protein